MKRPISFANACAQYVHRYTLEHVPAWAKRPGDNGRFYAPQYRSDREWYERTLFPGEGGIPRREDHCQSGAQSWPFGQWLKAPCPVYAYLAAHDDAKLAEMRAELEWTEPRQPWDKPNVRKLDAGSNEPAGAAIDPREQ